MNVEKVKAFLDGMGTSWHNCAFLVRVNVKKKIHWLCARTEGIICAQGAKRACALDSPTYDGDDEGRPEEETGGRGKTEWEVSLASAWDPGMGSVPGMVERLCNGLGMLSLV